MELLPKYLTIEQSNFVAFSILFKLFVKVLAIFFLELNCKGLYLIPEKKEKRKLLFFVYIVHKIWNQEVSCPMCGKAKKCTKKCDAYAELLLY